MANNSLITEIMDFVMAEAATTRAFMLSVSAEIAKQQTDPLEWMKKFIGTLHARIDVNEVSLGPLASRLPAHEMARKNFDKLGQELEKILREPGKYD